MKYAWPTAWVLFLGCQSAVIEARDESRASTKSVRSRHLDADVEAAVRALPRASAIAGPSGTASFVSGDLGVVSGVTESGLKSALGRIVPAFRVQSKDLRLRHLRKDELGLTHARYRQTKNGLAVIGGDLVLHVDQAGHVYAAHGTAQDGVRLAAAATLAPDAAARLARNGRALVDEHVGTPTLVYLVASSDQTLHLAYEVERTGVERGGVPVRDLVYVDALGGSIIETHPRIHGVLDRQVYSANHGTALPGTLERAEGGPPASDAVVNDHYGVLGTVHDYYATVYRRDSYDGAGAPLVSSIHYGVNHNNAYWDRTQMILGDGLALESDNLARSLETVAHELTHGVTEWESNLEYQGESGGINEALSDIFGESAEAWVHGAGDDDFTDASTFLLGDDGFTPRIPGDALRYLDDPTKDGVSIDDYADYRSSLDVHYSSGIANLAWSLLVKGGKHPRNRHPDYVVPAIGKAKASRIFYRANTTYLTANSNFEGLRLATRQAAIDLYDEATAAAVGIAFCAVGVPGCPGDDIVLEDGLGLPGQSGAYGSTTSYVLQVPSGTKYVAFSIRGGTGDADLFVRAGLHPTTTSADCGSPLGLQGNDELCTFGAPVAGPYYVMLHGRSDYAGVTVEGATWRGGPDGGEGALMPWPATASVPPRGRLSHAVWGGSGTGYVWSLATNASGAVINGATGLYVAGSTGGVTDLVRVQDSLGSVAEASVTVTASLTVSPSPASAPPRGTLRLTASGGSGAGYAWALSTNASGGTVGATTGIYTAGAKGATVDRVWVTDSLGNFTEVAVTVTAGLGVSPAPASAPPRGTVALTASGGSGAGYVWALSTNDSGGAVDAATGVYTAGTKGGTVDWVKVTDSLGNVGEAPVTVTAGVHVSPAPASAPPRGTLRLTASGGSSAGYAWALSTNASGGAIDAATGVYAAGARASSVDRVRVTDSLGNVGEAPVTVTAGVHVSPASASAPPRGTLRLTASGGNGSGYAWVLSTNASGGAIDAATGDYTAGPKGSVTDVARVVDPLGNSATVSVVVTAGLGLTPSAPSVPPMGSVSFTASGGGGTPASRTWRLVTNASGGRVKDGLYTAGATGGGADVVEVTDSLGNVADATVRVTAGIAVSPSPASAPPRGILRLSASGGVGSGYRWALSSSASGGSIDTASGTYVAGPIGDVDDRVQVTDALGNVAEVVVRVTSGLTVSPSPASAPPRGTLRLLASGGGGSGYRWALTSSASGATIDAASGTYVAGPIGGVDDRVQVADLLSNVAWVTVRVTAGLTVSPATASVPPRGSLRLSASGGSGGGHSWRLASNASGGSVDAATGEYTAGPTGDTTDLVGVRDSLGNEASVRVAVASGLALTPLAPWVAPKGSATFAVTGGGGTGYTWSLTSNPSGGTIDAGTGFYTSGATGGVVDRVQVRDSLGNIAETSVRVTAGLTVSPATASAAPGETVRLSVSGGSREGYEWSLASNPSGGRIDAATGAYTAGAVGGVTDEAKVTDSLGNVGTVNLSVTAGLALTPAAPLVAPKGQVSFTATGGKRDYTWSLVSGASGGSIVAATGAYTAGATGGLVDRVRVVDSLGNFAEATVTVTADLTVSPAAPSVPPRGTLPLSASGGSGAGYAWSLAVSDSGGSIDTATGAYTAGATGGVIDVVQVTDSRGTIATRKVQVGAALAISPSSTTVTPEATITLVATGGSGVGLTWSLPASPSGGAIDAHRGTYVAGATAGDTDVVRVTDSLGNVGTATVLVVAPATGGCGCTATDGGAPVVALGLMALLRRRRLGGRHGCCPEPPSADEDTAIRRHRQIGGALPTVRAECLRTPMNKLGDGPFDAVELRGAELLGKDLHPPDRPEGADESPDDIEPRHGNGARPRKHVMHRRIGFITLSEWPSSSQ